MIEGDLCIQALNLLTNTVFLIFLRLQGCISHLYSAFNYSLLLLQHSPQREILTGDKFVSDSKPASQI